MNKTFLKLVASATLLVASASTFASVILEEINGQLNFTGEGSITLNAAGDKIETLTFEYLDTTRDGGTNDLSTIGGYQSVSIFDITSFENLTLAGPLWAIAGFSFTLDTIVTNKAEGNFSYVLGTGVLSADGFADTIASWSFSADDTNTLSGLSFSASVASPANIPAPATMSLLGLALLGFAGSRYKK